MRLIKGIILDKYKNHNYEHVEDIIYKRNPIKRYEKQMYCMTIVFELEDDEVENTQYPIE